MMTTESEFNRFFAKALARTEKNPAEVSRILREISEKLEIRHKDGNFPDYIDPFTTMAYYNRVNPSNREDRGRELAFWFDVGCEQPRPESFVTRMDGGDIPFVKKGVEDYEEVVLKVWDCFRTFVAFAEGQVGESEFVNAFDYCSSVKGMSNKPLRELTVGLSWIDSEFYLGLDSYNMHFLEKNGIPHNEMVKLDGKRYLGMIVRAREILNRKGMSSFSDIADSAYHWGLVHWSEEPFNPGFTTEQWKAFLSDSTLFDDAALRVLKCIKDCGGGATCKQMSVKYGGDWHHYNAKMSYAAKKVCFKTGCDVPRTESGGTMFWPLLFIGSSAEVDREGSYVWTLRPEVDEALQQMDLSHIPLYDESGDKEEVFGTHLWFTARQSVWDLSILDVGDVLEVNRLNDGGRARPIACDFDAIYKGDIVIGYVSQPVMAIVSLLKVAEPFDGSVLKLEVVEKLRNPVGYNLWANDSFLTGLKNNLRVTLFKLNDDEFNRIMEIIRETNPEEPEEEDSLEPYTREDFLSQVYMTPKKYDDIVARIRRNRNVILKGAPGVGKTYAAKKLAYSMMGEIDESRVEFVQFHQSYTYEDFILGYKPSGDGFELREGVFHRFCSKAHRNPEKEFFFIIDEINRGNISRIFGELMMAIECDHRGEEVTLAYGQSRFSVPKNLYIIGMMNTADRSLAMIDYALRRRFGFFDIEPGFESEGFRRFMDDHDGRKFRNLVSTVMDINRAISNDDSLGKGFCIGHSYFCDYDGDEAMLEDIVEHDLIPLLEEYYYDDRRRFEQWADDLRGALHD